METTIKHRVKAFLYDNQLTEDPNDFAARVIGERTLDTGDICRMAVERGGADVSALAMQHAVELFHKEMAYQLCDGYSVNTGYFSAGAQIKGVFNSPRETFNADKHSVAFLFSQGEALRKELAGIEVAIMGVAEVGTEIAEVADVKSGSVNGIITPGRNIKIRGNKLKLAGESDRVGVFFVPVAGRVETKVDPTDVVVNNPSELIVVVPPLAAGVYALEVRTHYGGSKPVKELRSARFDKNLTVN